MLRIFLAVAERNSMTEAARALGVTQSAVSQAIRQLEDYLGVDVFDRVHRPLQLTTAGNVLMHRAANLITEIEQITASVRETGSVPLIRLGMVDSFAGTAGPYVLAHAMARIGNINVRDGVTQEMRRGLVQRELDLIVCMGDPVREDGIDSDTLMTENFLIAVPRAILKSFDAASLEALVSKLPLIRYSLGSSIGAQIELHLRRIGIAPPRRIELDGSDSVMAMVAENVGWSITTPLCVLHGRPNIEHVALLPFPGPAFERTLVLVSRSSEYTDVARYIARASRMALRNHCLPAFDRYRSNSGGRINVPDDPTDPKRVIPGTPATTAAVS